MSLANQLGKFRSEIADVTSRNIAHSRPTSNVPARTSTPKAGEAAQSTVDSSKRNHDTAFSQPVSTHQPHDLITQVWHSINYLKEKNSAVAFDDLINYLSLPQENLKKKVELVRRALKSHERVEHIVKGESSNGKESFKYRPTHPVTNADELKAYLARQPTAQGILVRELKDGWSGCVAAINELEKDGEVLVTRHKKENVPIRVWTNSPAHLLPVDSDLGDFWSKTKLPATEMDIRNELDKVGLTPTSQVKEVRKMDMKRKDRKRPNRRGGKTTNSHMMHILKDYTRPR